MIAIQNYKLTPEELQALQNKKLRRLVRHAYDRVPFYRKRFRSANLYPDEIRNVDDIRRLPIITREEILSERHSIIATGNTDDHLQRLTSGSTGHPLRILRDSRNVDRHFGSGLRNLYLLGVMPWFKAARIIRGESDDQRDTVGLEWGSALRNIRKVVLGPWLPRLRVPRSRTLTFRQNVTEVAPELLRFQPDFLITRPSYLMNLGEWFEGNAEKLRIPKIQCEAEYLSQNSRSMIERTFGGDVYNSYGSTEFGMLGCECRQHSLHIFSDHHILEVLKDGEPVAAGERGDVIVTGLDNEIMPLIRYELGDVAIPEDAIRCPCRSSFPRLRNIEGRKYDGLVLPGGTRVSPAEIIDYAESVVGLKRYQVIQETVKRVVLRITEKDTNASATLVTYLRKLFGSDLTVDIQLEAKESLVRFDRKNRPVISHVR